MLDPKLIRSDAEGVAKKLKIKKYVLDVAAFEALEEKRKALQVETETLQSERNTRSKSIGKAKASGEDIAPLIAEMDQMGAQLEAKKAELKALQDELNAMLAGMPNITLILR